MIDLDIYYAPDHRGHSRLRDIALYGLKYHKFLTEGDCQIAFDYYETVKTLVDNRTLHLQENCDWNRLNYRAGWDAVKGTQAEFLGAIIWNANNKKTKLELCVEYKEEQIRGMDAAIVNPRWTFDYVAQIKTLVRGENPKQIYINEDRYTKYDPKYVDRLILVDIDNLYLYHCSYPDFLSKYKSWTTYNHGFVDDNFKKLKHFHKFKLPQELIDSSNLTVERIK